MSKIHVMASARSPREKGAPRSLRERTSRDEGLLREVRWRLSKDQQLAARMRRLEQMDRSARVWINGRELEKSRFDYLAEVHD
jgi:hypothetical protein